MALFRQGLRIPAVTAQCCRLTTVQSQQIRGYSDMTFTMASPNKVFFQNEEVKQVNVPTMNGVFGILPKHVPTLAVLKPGVVAVTKADGSTANVFASSGSLTVNPDGSVHILAEEAAELGDLDIQAARAAMTKAQASLSSISSDKEKVLTQIEIDAYDTIIKAAEMK